MVDQAVILAASRIPSAFSGPVLWWAVGLAVGFPLLLVIFGEAIPRLRKRRFPIATTLNIVRNFVLPSLALYLFLSKVMELPPGFPGLRLGQTAMWLFVIHAALSFVNDVVFADAIEGTWQANFPKLLIDLLRLILVLIGTAIVLSTVWNLDLGNLIAALGIGSIIIGLALQEPLGNVFAGLMLMFERPLRIGEWVRMDETTGKVCEINWRAIHFETEIGELLVVPNSELSKGSFSNLSRPTKTHVESITLEFSYGDPPNKVKRVLRETAARSKNVQEEPPPTVWTVAYKDFSVQYRVQFTVPTIEMLDDARDDFMTRIWYASRRHGLTFPFPIQGGYAVDPAEFLPPALDPVDLWNAFPQFNIDDPAVADLLISRLGTKTFAQGESVIRAGDRIEGLHLVLKGQAAIHVRDASGAYREIARVRRGDYFGEGSVLAGEPSEVDVTAIDDVDVLVLDLESLQEMLDRTPRLAREIGRVMDVRRKAAHVARKMVADPRRNGDETGRARPAKGSPS